MICCFASAVYRLVCGALPRLAGGTLEGSRLYPAAICTHVLEPAFTRWACRAGDSREVS